VTTVGDLVSSVQSGFACGKEDPDGVFQLRMNNISKEGTLALDSRRRVPRDAHRDLSRFFVEPGDILFNATNSPDGVGKAVHFEKVDEPTVFSNHFLRLKTSAERVDSRFLWRWLQFLYGRGIFAAGCRQWVNQATYSKEDLLAQEVPLLALHEQRLIAEILDQADALRAKRRQALAHLDALTQSVFQDMFGSEFRRLPLAELVEEFRYGTSNKSGRGGYPTLRIPNVIGGDLNLSEIKTVAVTDAELERLAIHDGDILFVRSNGNPDNVGRTAVFDAKAAEEVSGGGMPWIYASYLIRGRLISNVVPAFAAAYLSSQDGKTQLRAACKTSAGQYNINIEGLSNVNVPDVTLARQRLFEARTSAVKSRRSAIARSSRALDALFFSLQSRAFRGEL
jgi:type I restriction enzyme, S subunit